jgi:hypothetical protein
MWVQESSFAWVRDVYVYMFLDVVCVFFPLVSKFKHGRTFCKQIYHCFQTPKPILLPS